MKDPQLLCTEYETLAVVHESLCLPSLRTIGHGSSLVILIK